MPYAIYNDNTLMALIKARRLVARPEWWTRRAKARNALGAPVLPLDAKSYAFCVTGAVEASVGGQGANPVMFSRCLFALGERLPAPAVPPDMPATAAARLIDWNDNPRTAHADVLSLFDAAITDCRRYGP